MIVDSDGHMANILFLSTNDGPFTVKDREMLGEKHNVTNLNVDVRDHPNNIVRYIKEIKRHDLLFGWFVSPSVSIGTIIATFFNKPTILVAGGYDVAREPDIGYGLTLNPKYRKLTQTALRKADKVLAVSDSNKNEILNITSKAEVETVYVGAIDTDTYKPKGKKDSDLVLTVGGIKDGNMDKKGLRHFAQTSKLFEGKKFVIVGKKTDADAVEELRNIGGDNLLLPGYVPFEELLDYYQRAKVYVQPSIHESFGVSVAEAMACECIPVVSQNGSLPEVAGETGVLIDELSPKRIQKAIFKAEKMDGSDARERVLKKFQKDQRKNELYRQIKIVCDHS